MQPFFSTEHLEFRQLTADDAPLLYANHLDDAIRKWFPNECYEDTDEAREAAEYFGDCVARNELPFVLGVVLAETGELIGDTGVSEVEGAPGEVEIGYLISSKYSGRGYATEVLKAMTDFSFSRFDVHTIYGRVIRGNDASARVLEKGGYVFVREEFGAEDDPYGNGMLVYKKDRNE